MKFVVVVISLLLSQLSNAGLTIYSDRVQDRFKAAISDFEAQTGEKVTYVELGYNDILARLQKEGVDSPADLVIAKDLVFLTDLKSKNLLQPMSDSAAVKRIHRFMKDDTLNWVGLTFRARSAVYDSSRTSPAEFSTYEDLASSHWAGRLCLRSSAGSYNVALASHLIDQLGSEKAKSILLGWVNNLATQVFPNDNAAMEAVVNGQCDVAIVNHYYLAGLLQKNPSLPLRMAFLDQGKAGVHTNGTGMGITKAAKNPQLAQTFIDLLLSDKIQLQISAAHFDYPVVKDLSPSTFIKDWGTFKMSSSSWSSVGNQVEAAKFLLQEVGYP